MPTKKPSRSVARKPKVTRAAVLRFMQTHLEAKDLADLASQFKSDIMAVVKSKADLPTDTYVYDGTTYKLRWNEPQPTTVLDTAALVDSIDDAAVLDAITDRVLNMDKLEAAVTLGLLDGAVVQQFTTQVPPRDPFISVVKA